MIQIHDGKEKDSKLNICIRNKTQLKPAFMIGIVFSKKGLCGEELLTWAALSGRKLP